jgi:outer membrane protein assembly factor BamB
MKILKTSALLLLLTICFCSCSHFQGVREEPKLFHLSWAHNIDPLYNTGNLPIALHSPRIEGDRLYCGHNAGEMIAYHLKTGRVLWKVKDGAEFHSVPTVYQDRLIYGTTEGRVYVRDRHNGELKYVIDLGASIESPGVVYKDRVFFYLRNHQIFCLDLSTGKILWAYKRSVPYQITLQRVSTPIITDDKMYVGFADGMIAALNINDGVVLWESKLASGTKFVDVDMTPLLWQDKLVANSAAGQFTFLAPDTGNTIRSLEITVTRTPLVLGQNLVVGTNQGEVMLIDPNANIVAQKKITSGLITSIGMWKNKIVVATSEGDLVALAPEDLAVAEKFSLGHAFSSVLGDFQIASGVLAVLSSRNRLYLFN